jgi:hypothetical protein
MDPLHSIPAARFFHLYIATMGTDEYPVRVRVRWLVSPGTEALLG